MSTEEEFKEYAYRCNVAFAEMGYQEELVTSPVPSEKVPGGWQITTCWLPISGIGKQQAMAVVWMAYKTSGAPLACWACWEHSMMAEPKDLRAVNCMEGDCTRGPDEHPYPPRELLVARA